MEEPQPPPALETQRKPPVKKLKKPEPVQLSAEFTLWTSDPWIREWLSVEPSLAGEDLRPDFFFSRDNLGLLGTAGQRLSMAARRALDKIKSSSEALRIAGLKELKALGEADANAVFEALIERAKREEDLGADNASLRPMTGRGRTARAPAAAHRRSEEPTGEGAADMGDGRYSECL